MKSLFKKYIQSIISPEEFEEFCKYIKQDKNLGSVSGFMETEWKSHLTDEDSLHANPLLLQKIQQAILQKEAKQTAQKLKVYSLFTKIAAVIIIGLLISGIWFYQQNETVLEHIPELTVSIPFGAKSQLQLPDGSTVWLNSGSSITYSGNFSGNRELKLNGEAFFDVVKSKNPFIVQTQYGNVEVLGTAFNVQAFNDGEFTTTLARGKVKVVNESDNESAMINPGEQIKLIQGKLVKSEVDTELFTSWKDGKLIFSRDSFPDIMKRLERWFNVEINYSENDFEGLWFSGTIESETLTEVMIMICKVAPVRYTYNSQKRTVKIEPLNN